MANLTGISLIGADSGNLALRTGGTDRLTIDSTGRVGIGTSNPSSLLALSGTASAITHARFSADGSGPVIELRKSRNATVDTNTIVQGGDVTGVIAFSGGNGTGYDPTAYIISRVDATPGASNDMPGRLEFLTTPDASATPVERMRIDSAGLVGINTITLGGASGSQVTITSSSNARAVLQTRGITGDVAEPSIDVIKFDNNNTTSQNFIEFYINNQATGSGKIVANGASAAAFGSFSDERLKENIANLPSQIDNILALRPVEFDYKDGSGHQIGFVAQEVQEIYPDLVGEDSGYLVLADLNKNDARLIKAFQELAAKVEALQTEVNALKNN